MRRSHIVDEVCGSLGIFIGNVNSRSPMPATLPCGNGCRDGSEPSATTQNNLPNLGREVKKKKTTRILDGRSKKITFRVLDGRSKKNNHPNLGREVKKNDHPNLGREAKKKLTSESCTGGPKKTIRILNGGGPGPIGLDVSIFSLRRKFDSVRF